LVLAQPITCDLRLDELADQVAARMRATLVAKIVEVLLELPDSRRGATRVLGPRTPSRLEAAEVCAPVEEQKTVIRRYTHQVADQRQREHMREVGDHVHGAAFEVFVEDRVDELVDASAKTLDHTRGKGHPHQDTQ